ncbi:glycosyltransferase [Bacillus sp. P14.5]|uniref:glycosyltransferase n=1 Tax=Bacillus sp. P14.5 TaxID=1983400 RepID=UPI000DE94FAA|nr:glycosyltransferase [Bacillus sp. P14.5]
MVARFSAQKDYKTLIQSITKVEGDFRVRLVGDGELIGEIKQIVLQLNLSDKVEFLGKRNDVIDLLRESDVFILSTNYEGLPISIIEAMSQGLPVVATDVGGVNELIADNKNGYLVRRKDSDQLAEKIKNLISDQALRNSMGDESYKRFRDKFTSKVMLDKTFNVYEEIKKYY